MWKVTAIISFYLLSPGYAFVAPTITSSSPSSSSFTRHISRHDHRYLNHQLHMTKKTIEDSIDINEDDRLYRVRVSRATGIEWGTDLSFSFVYVRAMDPSGSASMSGQVSIGDQLCEIIPIGSEAIMKPIGMIGSPFDFVMGAFASLDKTVTELDMVFFKGTKDELKSICTGGDVKNESDMITVSVIENKGGANENVIQLQAPMGVNIRQLLVDNGINVYQSVTRWTNCSGKQLCGTCIVNMSYGSESTNAKSTDEASTVRENPDSYRLSCVTFAYGDVTVETFPPVNAAQWTR